MKCHLLLPIALISYAEFHNLDAKELAEFNLEECSREYAEMLCEREAPGEECEPITELSAARN